MMTGFVPVARWLANKQRAKQKEAVAMTQIRTTHMNETVFGIKMIKM